MLVVLGGSTPWTIPLIAGLEVDQIALVGRNPSSLRAIRRYTQDQTTAKVLLFTDPLKALSQATLVLCQARIGGAAGRAADERGSRARSVWADETLGLGGLRSALRARSVLAGWARAANGVPALIFTNPTDLLARWWASHSGGPTVSLCEVPTALLASRPPGTRYLGINHLGFAVTADGELLPTKWITLLQDLPGEIRKQRSAPHVRAEIVATMTTRLRRAMVDGDRPQVERLLAERPVNWHDQLVIPVIESILGGRRFRGVVGLPNERRLPNIASDVFVESIGSPLTPEQLGVEVKVTPTITELAVARERAWRCLVDLNEDTLRAYLSSDPFVAGLDYRSDLLHWLRSEK
jgi:alpha-galactosidase/6-phospho-beta-glucosidase family protein